MRGKLFRVIDAFAEFGIERRIWIDPEALQSRYHELAVVRHPDKCAGDPLPLSRLNEARGILASHSSRLLHLLNLTGPQPAGPGKYQPDFEIFSRVGMLTKNAERLSAGSSSSPLAAAVNRAETSALQKEIARMLDEIACRIDMLEQKLRGVDPLWPDVDTDEIRALADEFTFLKKWRQLLLAAQTLLLGG